MKENLLTDLLREASAMIDADRKVVKAVVENQREDFYNHLAEFRDNKIKVRKILGSFGVIANVDSTAKEVLLRVQEMFPTDNILEQLANKLGEDTTYYELSDAEVDELGSELFYSWISHYEYVRNIFKVNALILQTTVPKELTTYVREARDCFALQQHNAVVSMCRTILEAAAKDLCEKQGYFATSSNVISINPKVFNQLINAVCSGNIKKRAISIYYKDGCPVVHGDRSIHAEEALRVLRATLDVIQELYSLYESKIARD